MLVLKLILEASLGIFSNAIFMRILRIFIIRNFSKKLLLAFTGLLEFIFILVRTPSQNFLAFPLIVSRLILSVNFSPLSSSALSLSKSTIPC